MRETKIALINSISTVTFVFEHWKTKADSRSGALLIHMNEFYNIHHQDIERVT
jgi:hypothetical protein